MSESRPVIPTDIYPVGLLRDWRDRRVRYGLRSYLWSYCIKGRRWRSARNYFNGYLAEHESCAHDCGKGWTRQAAHRQVIALCEASQR